mgnify:FL=1
MQMGVDKWLVDTGCPYNLVDWKHIEESCLASRVDSGGPMVRLNTANGATRSSDSIKVACSQFEEGDFTACVLPSTPSVISVGERCITYGYGFHWPAWSSKPYLESPCGRIIWLTVENKLPYLYTCLLYTSDAADD